MRVALFGLLALPLLVAGCGHSSPSSTLSVSCGGSTALVGAKSVDVAVDPVSKTTILSFPDPVNSGQTGTITLDRRCTIVPTPAS